MGFGGGGSNLNELESDIAAREQSDIVKAWESYDQDIQTENLRKIQWESDEVDRKDVWTQAEEARKKRAAFELADIVSREDAYDAQIDEVNQAYNEQVADMRANLAGSGSEGTTSNAILERLASERDEAITKLQGQRLKLRATYTPYEAEEYNPSTYTPIAVSKPDQPRPGTVATADDGSTGTTAKVKPTFSSNERFLEGMKRGAFNATGQVIKSGISKSKSGMWQETPFGFEPYGGWR